jgi:tagatose 6-phosphate kinase
VIVASGLSPAWQQILVFDALRRGEVNRAAEVHWCGSGKVLNVGLALARLGVPHKVATVLGGSARDEIARDLAAQGVRLSVVEVARPTRVCTTIIDRRDGSITELVENASPISEIELAAFEELVMHRLRDGQFLAFSGTLPAGTDPHVCHRLTQVCEGQAVLDIKGEPLMYALEARPVLVKPNREELASTLNKDVESGAGLVASMREINALGARWCLVTDGPRPAWLTSRDRAYRFSPSHVKPVNTIGCGDALTAAAAAVLAEGGDIIDAVRRGMAVAAANAETLLPCRIEPGRVDQLEKGVRVEAVE